MSRLWTLFQRVLYWRSAIAGLRTAGTGLALSAFLMACAGPQERPVVTQANTPAPTPAPAPSREPPIQQWLDQADRALSADRLLSPLGDNAHDRYRAVLLYEPDNRRAISGLQAIALRYLELARLAAARGAFSQAEGYLGLAEEVDPGNPLVAEFAERVDSQQVHLQHIDIEAESVVRLDPGALGARSGLIVAQLQALAKQVRDSGEFVLIVSRTDAEGRWIYQQMRDAVPNHLLRGDIQLGSPPRVELQPPL